jgi:hypothetical protein
MVAQSFASSPFYYDVAEIGLAKRHAQIVFCTVKRGREPQILAKVFDLSTKPAQLAHQELTRVPAFPNTTVNTDIHGAPIRRCFWERFNHHMIGFQLSYNDGGCHFSRLLSSNNLMLGVIFASVVTQVTPASGMLQAFGQGRRAHTDCQAFPRFSRRDSTVERGPEICRDLEVRPVRYKNIKLLIFSYFELTHP